MIFLLRFTCLLASYVPIVAIHPIGGSHANRHHVPNPQLGAAQPTQDGDPQVTSNPLEHLFMISHGDTRSRTPHNHNQCGLEQSPTRANTPSLLQAIYASANAKSNKKTIAK